MTKKIAAVLANLFEDSEFTSPVEELKKAGHEVITIGFKKGETVTGSKGTKVDIEKGIDDVKAENFDALLIPGGYSPDKLRADERFLQFVQHFSESEKPIFSICHGPQLLINAQVVRGKKITSVKQVETDLRNAGADFYDKEVVKDESGLISSRTPSDLPAFNKAILEALED